MKLNILVCQTYCRKKLNILQQQWQIMVLGPEARDWRLPSLPFLLPFPSPPFLCQWFESIRLKKMKVWFNLFTQASTDFLIKTSYQIWQYFIISVFWDQWHSYYFYCCRGQQLKSIHVQSSIHNLVQQSLYNYIILSTVLNETELLCVRKKVTPK